MPGLRRYLTVHYRKLRRDADSFPQGTSLSQAIDAALHITRSSGQAYADDWNLRVTNAPDNPDQSRFVNNFHVGTNSVFGNLCSYTQGEMQAVLATQSGRQSAAREVNISDLAAPGGNDYLHGIAYWLVVGDHCYVVQHDRVRTKALEDYLTWLLRDEIAITSGAVTLQAEFDASAVGGDLGDVVAIEVGGLAPETIRDREDGAPSPLTRDVESRRSLAERKAPFSRALDVVRSVFGEFAASKILREMPRDAALDVNVRVSWVTRRREIDRDALNKFSLASRNLDDGEVWVRSRDGSVRKGDARLHMKMPFNRLREHGNLLDLEHAQSQLMEVHTRFLADGKISAD